MTVYYQQGDILLFLVNQDTWRGDAPSTKLCHKGDNHEHHFEHEVFQDEDLFLLNKETKLLHFEHKTITLPAGIYRKKIVKEFDHFTEEARNVID